MDKFLVQSGNAGMTVVSGTAGDAIAGTGRESTKRRWQMSTDLRVSLHLP